MLSVTTFWLSEAREADCKVRSFKDLDDHPSMMAWRRLHPTSNCVEQIEALKKPKKIRWNQKSAIFRLTGIGPKGRAIIAKRCRQDTGLVECRIYREILAKLPVSSVNCLGFVEEDSSGYCWIFLEDVSSGSHVSAECAEHRELVATWLAQLHVAVSGSQIRSRLPDRGPGYYKQHLTHGQTRILENIENPALNQRDRNMLDATLMLLSTLRSKWNDFEAFCDAFPPTLVHGDFVPKNMRIRTVLSEQALLPFDWEEAGWGVAAVDLFWLDLSTYAAIVRKTWSNIGTRDIFQLASLGKTFRYVASINWASEDLRHSWPQRSIRRLGKYELELATTLKEMDLG
jgi:hypothetical protein